MPIWIDAVCIDQSNNEEKSWQVERMGSIYSWATSTLIFLGQARSEAEAKQLETVIPILGRLGAMALDWKILGDERDKQMFYTYASVLRWMDDMSPKLGISPHEFMVRQVATDLVSLRELGAGLLPFDCILARPWWSRIWVSQPFSDLRAPANVCTMALGTARTLRVSTTNFPDRFMHNPRARLAPRIAPIHTNPEAVGS
jgi:hypothetical protein